MNIGKLISELQEIVKVNGGDTTMPVHVIFDGKIDTNPTINVDDSGIVYIEGVKEK